MTLGIRKALAVSVLAATVTALPGCSLTGMFDNIDGAIIGMSCQLDAMMGAHRCHPTGSFHRKSGAYGSVDLSDFTIQFQAMGTDISSYPSSVEITLWNNGYAIAMGTFALSVDSQGVATLADPAGASSWINSYSATATDATYTTNDLLAPVYSGTNTITADNVILGTSVASSSWSGSYSTGFTPYPGPR